MSLSNSPLRSPLNFEVTCLDDLLIWADLWIDYNEPLYADACRWAHKNKRWPKKYAKQYRWYVLGEKRYCSNPCNIANNYAEFPDRFKHDYMRCYASPTLAYLDLFNHMTMDPKVFLRELKSPSSS